MSFIHAFDSANKVVKAVNCDSSGNLQVDIVSGGGGGDASATNQVTGHAKLDTIAGKLDTLDSSVNTIEGCVSTGELAVAHSGLTELASAINSQKVDVNIASDGISLATSANQSTANGYLANVNSATYLENDSPGISSRGMAAMAVNPTGKTTFLQASSSGDLHVEISDFVKGQATMASSFPVAIASNQAALSVTHAAFSEIENAINSNKMDVNIASPLGQATAASSIPVTLASNQPSIAVTNAAVEPTLDQATLASGASITAGSSTSEIDMNGYKHLTIYGTSSVNFGSFILARRATSGGGNILDSSAMMSASDPTGGSNYHFSATFKDVGNRYVAFQNTSSGSQTVTLYVVKHR